MIIPPFEMRIILHQSRIFKKMFPLRPLCKNRSLIITTFHKLNKLYQTSFSRELPFMSFRLFLILLPPIHYPAFVKLVRHLNPFQNLTMHFRIVNRVDLVLVLSDRLRLDFVVKTIDFTVKMDLRNY